MNKAVKARHRVGIIIFLMGSIVVITGLLFSHWYVLGLGAAFMFCGVMARFSPETP